VNEDFAKLSEDLFFQEGIFFAVFALFFLPGPGIERDQLKC
jgi:hypothetical protein